jgi:hypothetical protein
MFKEIIKAKGDVYFELRDQFGNIKESSNCNLVVNSGLSFITSRVLVNTAAPVSHMALGTGTTEAALTNTGLEIPLGPRVGIASGTQVTTNITNDSVQYTCTFAAGTATGGITEAALFNAETEGTMIARTVFPVINKGPLDVLAIVWKITIY